MGPGQVRRDLWFQNIIGGIYGARTGWKGSIILGQDWRDQWVQDRLGGIYGSRNMIGGIYGSRADQDFRIYGSRTGLEGSMGSGQVVRDLWIQGQDWRDLWVKDRLVGIHGSMDRIKKRINFSDVKGKSLTSIHPYTPSSTPILSTSLYQLFYQWFYVYVKSLGCSTIFNDDYKSECNKLY